jgi:hypothetical protein
MEQIHTAKAAKPQAIHNENEKNRNRRPAICRGLACAEDSGAQGRDAERSEVSGRPLGKPPCSVSIFSRSDSSGCVQLIFGGVIVVQHDAQRGIIVLSLKYSNHAQARLGNRNATTPLSGR